MAKEIPVGKITHFFSKIGVAVIELDGELKLGDTIRIVGGKADFQQTVDSMEIEHQKIEKAKIGDLVAIKLKEKVRPGYKVFKIEK
jgi:translation elongation factor EF-1alpha